MEIDSARVIRYREPMPHSGMLALLAMLAVLAPAVAAGDEPAPAEPTRKERTWWGATQLKEQWTPGVPRSQALDVPDTITRDDQVQPVSLKEAITLALENNPGIQARRLEPVRQEAGILEAQGVLDPTLAGEARQDHSQTPNTSTLTGRRTSKIDLRNANLHLFKTFRSGTVTTFDFLNERLDNNAQFFTLRPQYTPILQFSVIQPLLRNFGWDFTYTVVRVAEQTADAAVYSYNAALADFVTQVIESYWIVVATRDNLEVQRESHALALRTVEENEARVRVGLLPPVATLEAQADAKSREEQVIVAENQLAIARQRLAQLAFYRPAGTFVPRTLEPAEEATPEAVIADLDQTLNLALKERPEIHASEHGVVAQQLNEKIAGNALLPRLDLVGSYGVNAVSGRARPFTQTVVSGTDLGGGNCVQIPNTPDPLFVCQFTASSTFAGSRGDAYDRLTDGDFRQYSFGLQFQVPLSNALARGQYTQSKISREQAELRHRDLLSQVTLEVRQSVAEVISTRQRIDTSRVARELAEENLRNQEKRHEVGMATTKDLLDFQTRLTSARAAEVSAKIDHAIAVARWRRAKGQILEHYQVLVERPGRDAPPWFAKF